jgi:hypothetical protein
MKNLWMFLGVLAAVILSGCQAENPIPEASEYDWCYLFDFVHNANGFLIEHGSITADGLTADAEGFLKASFQYDREPHPLIAVVTFRRPDTTVGDVHVTAIAYAFRIVAIVDETVPAIIDNAVMAFELDANSESIQAQLYKDQIQIQVESDQPLAIERIEVRGMGANPFPDNYCGNYTPTPTPPATGTPPTATATPLPWECVYDFTLSDAGWSTSGDFLGTPRDGTGFHSYVNEDDLEGMAIELTFPETITTTEILFEYTYAGGPFGYGSGIVTNTGIIIFRDSTLEFPQPYTDFFPRSFNFMGITFIGETTFERITMQGTGNSPCDPESPTATPGGSSTPLPSATFEPLWGSCVDFTYNDYLFIAEGAAWEDGAGFIQEDDIWSVGRGSFGITAKKKIKLQFAAGQTFTGDVRLTDNAANATDWNTVSGNTIITDFSGDAWTPTNTFWVEFDGNNVPLTLEKICWLDPQPSTQTPGPGTGTPFGTRTPLAVTVNPTYQPSRTPFGIPGPYNQVTTTPGVLVTTTPIYSGTGVVVITGTPFGTPSGGGGTGSTGGTGGSGGVGSGSGDAGDLIGFGWTIGNGMLGAGAAYLGQVADVAGGMLSTLNSAPPTGIPGLPMCITNPMAHDICAIYYILDFTIFAEGTPGALIIPFLLVVMNFYIVIRFVRWGMRIVKRSEGISDAN